MKAGKAPFSQQLDEAIYRKPGGHGEEGAFHEVAGPCERAEEGSLGQRRAVWGSAPGPLSPSAVGQGRTASEPPAPDTSPVEKGAGESSPNHGEGWETPDLPMKRYSKQGM